MRRRRRVRDERLRVAEVVRDVDDLEGVHQRERLVLATVELERDDRPAAEHLALGEVVLRVRLQEGVDDARDPGVRLEEPGHLEGAVGHPLDAQRHRLEALDEDPRVERRHRRAGVPHEVLHRAVDELLRPEHGAAEGAALPVDVLRRGVDGDVGAEVERLGEDRRAEDVVDDDLGSGRVGQLAHGGDVDELLHGVARRLEEHGRGRLGERLAPLVEVRAVDEDGLDAPPRQDLVEDDEARAEEGPRGDDAVALTEQGRERDEDRRHAGARCEARLGALDLAQPLLEHRHGRVAVAGVDVAVDVTLEGRLGILGRVVDEAGGQVEGLGSLFETTAGEASSHREGVGAPALRRVRRVAPAHPCTHGRPATFHPDTARWRCGSCGPSKPSRTLRARAHPSRVAASAAATERTPERHKK